MKIFGLVGKKQSGKNTAANVVHGMVMKKMGLITDYKISDHGVLLIKSPNALRGVEWVEFDVTRRDAEFIEYAESTFWPWVKCYSFADTLKDIIVHLFQVPPECVRGTDVQKNTPIDHMLWENMPGTTPDPAENTDRFYHPKGAMTGRELMQFFGTEIMRKMWGPVWLQDCMNKIITDSSEIALITDVRFPNEGQAIHDAPGNLLYLPRSVHKDGHASEAEVDNINRSLFTRELKDGTLQEMVAEIEMLFTPIVAELNIIEG
jgi:hypothetical protein